MVSRRMSSKRTAKGQHKFARVMREFYHGDLHSGSKIGPTVHSRRQAQAIAYSEIRRGKK